jgi:hypothetical protein
MHFYFNLSHVSCQFLYVLSLLGVGSVSGEKCKFSNFSLCAVLGAFAKLRKATARFVVSVRPRRTAGLPLDGFS